MKSEKQKLLLLGLLDRLLKSWWTLVAGVGVGLSGAIVALHLATPVYEAEALIEADVETLPSQFVRRTISDNVEVQLPVLKRAVLSDENIKEVIRAVHGTPRSPSHEETLADAITSNVMLFYSARSSTISVRYRNQVPEKAARVTNLLADLFIVENQQLRASSAGRVRESIESLASNVETELAKKKKELSELLAKHANELESQRVRNEQMIEKLEEELGENQQAARAAERALGVLEARYARSRSPSPGDTSEGDEQPPPSVGGRDPRMTAIEQELEQLLIKLTENHPDVVAKRRELERYREADAEGLAAVSSPELEESGEPLVQPPAIDIWQTRLAAARLDVKRLNDRDRGNRQKIARYRGYLNNTPLTQARVDELSARVEVLERMDLENQQNIEAAKTGQRLEQDDIANPFVVKSHAGAPSVPVSPNRIMFFLGGIGVGLALFVGPLLAGGLLRPSILSEANLKLVADIPVLVSIPVIETPEAQRLRRRAVWRNLGLSALVLGLVGAVGLIQLMEVL